MPFSRESTNSLRMSLMDERFLYDHINNQLPAEVQVTSFTGMSWEDLKHHAHDIAKILVYDMQTDRLLKARKQIECIENITVTDYQPISLISLPVVFIKGML